MEIASKGQLRLAFLRWAVVTVPFILLLGFASARIAPTGADNLWYQMLEKPAQTPPDWVFPVIWAVVYALLGLALAMIINARGSTLRGPALAVFAVQMGVGLGWAPLFFGMHQVFWAMVLAGVAALLALVTLVMFGRIRTGAAVLMIPYLGWLGLAGWLCFQIDQLNPNAQTLVPAQSAPQMSI